MNRMNLNLKQQQGGAALVVGLILLVALTLMALSSMNTASLDLVMVRNSQYQSRAFIAAESGIEDALKLDNATGYGPDGYPTTSAVSAGTGSDTYSYEITLPYGKQPTPQVDDTGVGYGAMYYRITSTGTSAANATAVHVQDLYIVVPSSGEMGYDDNLCSKDLDDSC